MRFASTSNHVVVQVLRVCMTACSALVAHVPFNVPLKNCDALDACVALVLYLVKRQAPARDAVAAAVAVVAACAHAARVALGRVNLLLNATCITLCGLMAIRRCMGTAWHWRVRSAMAVALGH
jgi:hypothetical protein